MERSGRTGHALSAAVEPALIDLAAGRTADTSETEVVDFKEEAGRRGSGGTVLVGGPFNQAVAEQVSNEVACLANTAGGGALVLGVADDGTLIGADTDRDWLRQRVHERVDLAPAIEERRLGGGTKVLVVLVAEAREPVEDTNGRIRWRVGRRCATVDRSEWWAQRLRRLGGDPLTAETSWQQSDIPAAALAATRRILRSGSPDGVALRELSDRELLTRLGVLLPNGRITAAGVHMFGEAPRTVIELAVLDVPGGDVIATVTDQSGLSLIEQLSEVESRLDALDTAVVLGGGLHLGAVRRVPWPGVREALLNAVVHRDWLPAEPIQVTWIQTDSTLDVVSPGGFAGGVTSRSVLSARYSRNPAVADLARALGLVERQGVGVDRMYREMVALGHRPPTIIEEPGPRVRTRLVGGEPLTAVMSLMSAIEPVSRQRDLRVALAVHALLRDGFVAPPQLSTLLQVPVDEASEALELVEQCLVGGRPMIRPSTSGAWLPGTALVSRATADDTARRTAQRRGLLRWWRPDAAGAQRLVRNWLAVTDRITTGDFAEITTFSPQAALQSLNRLAADGVLQRGPDTRGRLAHFVAGDRP